MLKLSLVCRQLYETIDENAAKVRVGLIESDCIQRVQEVFDKTWATHTVLDDASLSTYQPPRNLSRHFYHILNAQKKPVNVSERIKAIAEERYSTANLSYDELLALDLHAKSRYERNLIFRVYSLVDMGMLTKRQRYVDFFMQATIFHKIRGLTPHCSDFLRNMALEKGSILEAKVTPHNIKGGFIGYSEKHIMVRTNPLKDMLFDLKPR